MKKNTIGKRIAEARINLNITQEQLEELSGFSVSTISRFETGRTQPSIENLIKLSKVLNVGIDYFLYDLIPHNETIQSPTVKDAVTVLSQMNERQAQYMSSKSTFLSLKGLNHLQKCFFCFYFFIFLLFLLWCCK